MTFTVFKLTFSTGDTPNRRNKVIKLEEQETFIVF